LLISREAQGTTAYCFRCDDTGWMPGERETTAEILARLAKGRAADEALRAELPVPQVHDMDEWPAEARVWLFKAGMGRPEARAFGAFYHPPTGRVVLPLGGYWTARSVDGRMPKYLGATQGREHCVPRYGEPGRTIAVTEDVLSAWKIGRAGGWGWCALGVKPSARFIRLLLDTGQRRVVVALDPDPPGQVGARKICKALSAAGLDPVNLVLPRDPKLLQLDFLRTSLAGAAGTGAA
jgi:DNA primase